MTPNPSPVSRPRLPRAIEACFLLWAALSWAGAGTAGAVHAVFDDLFADGFETGDTSAWD